MSFKGQKVYITGGSSGLGRGLAALFAAEGAEVALFARRLGELEAVALKLRESGGSAHAFAADVTDNTSVRAAMTAAQIAIGPADILIASAGVSDPVSPRRFDGEKAAHVMKVNVLGMMYAMSAVIPAMVERKRGQIVGLSSLASYLCFPGGSAYSSSKTAVNMLLRCLRAELAPHGVIVQTVCPGFVRTEMTANPKIPMPFMLSCDEACARIFAAVRQRKKVYNFPKRMYLATQLARLVPDNVVMRAMGPHR